MSRVRSVRRTHAWVLVLALAPLFMGARECGAPEASEDGDGLANPTDAGALGGQPRGGANASGGAGGTNAGGAGGTAGTQTTGGAGGASAACFYQGIPYSSGQQVPSPDGCNTCACVGTSITCTERACLDAGPQDAGELGTQCSDAMPCPQPACACLDENADGVCDNHCPTFSCVDGSCVDTSQRACGGLLGLPCLDGEYCNYPIAAMCGAADQTGFCAPILEGGCTLQYDPVCGCDGTTYGNDCAAATAGVSVASVGECD